MRMMRFEALHDTHAARQIQDLSQPTGFLSCKMWFVEDEKKLSVFHWLLAVGDRIGSTVFCFIFTFSWLILLFCSVVVKQPYSFMICNGNRVFFHSLHKDWTEPLLLLIMLLWQVLVGSSLYLISFIFLYQDHQRFSSSHGFQVQDASSLHLEGEY